MHPILMKAGNVTDGDGDGDAGSTYSFDFVLIPPML